MVSSLNDSNKIYDICIVSPVGSGRNIADEGILWSTVYSLKKEIPNARIRAFCADPEYIQGAYNIETIPRLKTVWGRARTMFRAFKEAHLIIHDGAIRFYDSGYRAKLLQYTLAKLLRKPTMFYGVGALPIKSKIGKLLTRHIVNSSAAITVRQKSSMGFLKELKVKKDIILAADPAFLLQPVLSERLEKKLNEISETPKKTPLVGICTGPLSNKFWRAWGNFSPLSEEFVRNFKLSMAQLADFIIGELGQALFIPFQLSPQDPTANDLETFRDIAELMNRKDRVKVLDDARYTAQELAALIGKLDLLLSGRFHGLIYAALSSVPMVAIACGVPDHSINYRFYDFMESIGQGNLVCSIEAFDYDDCISKLDYAWSHRDLIKQQIKPKVEALKEKAALNAKIARELLK